MISFAKLYLAANDKDAEDLVSYFTQNKPEPINDPAKPKRKLDPATITTRDELTAYYTGRNNRAMWRQDMPLAVAKALGIDPRHAPTNDELKKLWQGQHAGNGQAWDGGKRTLCAYDFTFSPHKSVSLAAEFAASPAETAAIRHAVAQANDDVMTYIAQEIGYARKGDGGKDGADPGDVGWASFTHYDSRPTMAIQDGRDGPTRLLETDIAGDPQDHIHNAIFNLVVTADGRVGSLDTSRIHSRVHEFGAYGQARLADRLRALGISVGYDEKEQAVVILAIPKIANDTFSKNRQQILRKATAHAEEQGLDWNDLSLDKKKEIIFDSARTTRHAKHADKTDAEVWRDQARAIGWEHTTVMEDATYPLLTDDDRFEKAYATAARHLAEDFHTNAIIEYDKLRTHATRGLIIAGIDGGAADIDRVTDLIKKKGIDFRGEHVDLLIGEYLKPAKKSKMKPKPIVGVTTTAQIRIEESLVAEVKRASLDKTGALPNSAIRAAIETSGLDFDSERDHGRKQIAAIYTLGKGGAITLLTGVAGAGKSTLLRPLVAAWKADTRFAASGRDLIGISTAWNQADQLQSAGIANTFALARFLNEVEKGQLAPTRNTVLVIDEIGQIPPRAMLTILELQARTGMTIKALGDREQAQSIEAGDTIELMRRALPKSANPELLSTVRQIDRRDRTIANLFRSENAAEALAMKREDGTVCLAGGDYDQVNAQIAALYLERRDLLRTTNSKHGITISAPTNEDAAAISMAVRQQLKARGGEIGDDETIHKAIAPRGDKNSILFDLPLATGDHVRLFHRTWSQINGKGGYIGNNGHIVEVAGKTATHLLLRDKQGRVGHVEWSDLTHEKTGRLMLGFGHAVTIDAIQGVTSDEHINALPRGAAGLTAFKAYVAESRARGATWTVISHAAVHEVEKRSRAIGDPAPILEKDLWTRVAADMSFKPYKPLAIDLLAITRQNSAKIVDSFLRQSHKFFTWRAKGHNIGQETRERLEAQNANELLAGQLPALTAAVAENRIICRETLNAADTYLANERKTPAPAANSPAPQAPTSQAAAAHSPSPGDTGELELSDSTPSPGM